VKISSLSLILGLVSVTAASGANLLTNGGFEGCPAGNSILPSGDSSINGWTTANEGVEWFRPADFGLTPGGGQCAVDLAWFTSNGTPGGAIEQTIATTIGQLYNLSLIGATSTYAGRLGIGTVDLILNGTPTVSFILGNNTPDLVWQPIQYAFVATASSTTIRFANTEDAFQHFAMIDDVSVEAAVPEPGTWALMGLGLATASLTRRRRRS